MYLLLLTTTEYLSESGFVTCVFEEKKGFKGHNWNASFSNGHILTPCCIASPRWISNPQIPAANQLFENEFSNQTD